jgi:hypothetical protein
VSRFVNPLREFVDANSYALTFSHDTIPKEGSCDFLSDHGPLSLLDGPRVVIDFFLNSINFSNRQSLSTSPDPSFGLMEIVAAFDGIEKTVSEHVKENLTVLGFLPKVNRRLTGDHLSHLVMRLQGFHQTTVWLILLCNIGAVSLRFRNMVPTLVW